MKKVVLDLVGHTRRVGCVAWASDVICSGGGDHRILQRDIRERSVTRSLLFHEMEVCSSCG